jgi:hypothetical protein
MKAVIAVEVGVLDYSASEVWAVAVVERVVVERVVVERVAVVVVVGAVAVVVAWRSWRPRRARKASAEDSSPLERQASATNPF